MISTATILFFIIDPFGLIPIFAGILGKLPRERRLRVLGRELLVALIALIAFLFAGKHLLQVLHISGPALSIAGAIILFLIALAMIFPSIKLSFEAEGGGEPFIVPLAIPLFAGPSAIAMVMLIGATGPANAWFDWILAVFIAWFAAAAALTAGVLLADRLGRRVLIALERLMGMLLVAIAVEMFLGGIRAFQAAA